jgi:hypothetical protein
MADFDAKKMLQGSVSDVTSGLADLTFGQVEELEATERAKGADARSSLLKALQGEMAARKEAFPGIDLSDESVGRIVDVLAHVAVPSDDLSGEHRATLQAEVRDMLGRALPTGDENPAPMLVHALAPFLLEIERLNTALQGAPRETVPEGQIAEPERNAERTLAMIASIAFCDADDTVLFKLPAKPSLFNLRGRKAAYGKPVVLAREKKCVAVSQAVALDAQGRPVARVRWSVPLVGGGGKLAEFPAGHVAFDL